GERHEPSHPTGRGGDRGEQHLDARAEDRDGPPGAADRSVRCRTTGGRCRVAERTKPDAGRRLSLLLICYIKSAPEIRLRPLAGGAITATDVSPAVRRRAADPCNTTTAPPDARSWPPRAARQWRRAAPHWRRHRAPRARWCGSTWTSRRSTTPMIR